MSLTAPEHHGSFCAQNRTSHPASLTCASKHRMKLARQSKFVAGESKSAPAILLDRKTTV
jgi:hypothetical protein